jgi:hypothetical protein
LLPLQILASAPEEKIGNIHEYSFTLNMGYIDPAVIAKINKYTKQFFIIPYIKM